MIRANKYLRIANAKETLFGVVKTIAGKQSCKCQHFDTIRRGEQNKRKKRLVPLEYSLESVRSFIHIPFVAKYKESPGCWGKKMIIRDGWWIMLLETFSPA